MIRWLVMHPELFVIGWIAVSLLVAALFGLWIRASRREMEEGA